MCRLHLLLLLHFCLRRLRSPAAEKQAVARSVASQLASDRKRWSQTREGEETKRNEPEEREGENRESEMREVSAGRKGMDIPIFLREKL